jgi:anti-sigma factor RsiW
MRCEETQQLFNAYLDGELSPSLTTELDAHRLQCAECRRSLAILEVTGHVLSSGHDPVTLKEGFTDRLLACVDTPARRRWNQIRRYAYVGGPLAAAAVIALAFLGLFDRGRQSKVAGLKVEPLVQTAPQAPAPTEQGSPTAEEIAAADKAIDAWIEQMRVNLDIKRQSGASLQKALDLTILQVLDILEQLNDRSAPHFPGADVNAPFSPDEPPPVDDEDVEDL